MQNPILAMLSGNNQNPQQNNLSQRLGMIKQLLSGKDSTILYSQMLQANPKFREFVKNAEGKTIEDLAMEYDIDLSLLKQFL